MSLETIHIARQFPIINNFVVLPNNLITTRTSVPVDTFTALTGGTVVRLSHTGGAGRNGRRFGPQEWVEFEGDFACCGYDSAVETGKDTYETNKPTDDPKPWDPNRDSEYPDKTPDSPGVDCGDIDCSIYADMLLAVNIASLPSWCCKGFDAIDGPFALTYTSGPGYCYWYASRSSQTVISALLQLINNNGYCYWQLTLYCIDTGDLIYIGYLEPVAENEYSPEGTYTQTAGCAALTINVGVP